MVVVDQEFAAALPPFSKKKQQQSTVMKRTSEWIYSQDIPSDITVRVGEATFSLHKYALLSKCGYLRKLITKSSDSDHLHIKISDIPGGVEAFELTAMYCYGINFEINVENIAMLRCAAEYLGMNEDCSVGNLVSRTEAFLEIVALISLSSAVTVLHKSEDLVPMSERVNLVSRCIDAVAYLACNDTSYHSNGSLSLSSYSQPKAIVDWWAEELMVLRIDTFQRVLMAMKARGLQQDALGPVIMLYAQKSLRGLEIFSRGARQIEAQQEHEKRVVLETVVILLPRERNAMSVSFLSMLLRAALFLEATVACRFDLEKRISLQLDQAVLDDLLIPSFSCDGGTVYDVNTVRRIMIDYFDNEVEIQSDGEFASAPINNMEHVGKLMEDYLAEIASDQNLPILSFSSLAELIPEQARINDDGMYRAIDIYLKAHPSLTDMQRKKVCSLMDFQKLSREACAHAAKNGRLPVQTVVQVLYYEQQRLRDNLSRGFTGSDSPAPSRKMTSYVTAGSTYNPNDELLRLRRENGDLKLELVKMRMQQKESTKPSDNSTTSTSSDKPPLPKKSIVSSVSKKISRLNPFTLPDSIKLFSSKARTKPPKDRRHSIA